MTTPDPNAAPPPFRFTRESRIRIDRDGHVWHEGERVAHPRLEAALASWIDFDDASGRYVLRNTLDWCYVTVDHAPLVVRGVRAQGDDPKALWFEVTLSDESTERLRVDTVRVAPGGEVYAYVRGGRLLALFDRAAAFTLLEHAAVGPDGGAALAGVTLKTLGAGELPPPTDLRGATAAQP